MTSNKVGAQRAWRCEDVKLLLGQEIPLVLTTAIQAKSVLVCYT